MAHRVDVFKVQQLEFPDRCVDCGAESPASTISIKAALSDWKPLQEDLFKRWKAEVPCCESCRGRVARHRLVARLLWAVAAAVAAFAILVVLSLWPGITQGWGIYAVIPACVAIPVAVVQAILTPAVELTPRGNRLVFEFRDRSFADAFAERNDSRVI